MSPTPHDLDDQPTLFTRYDDWRTRRFLANEIKLAHYLPTWRNQRRRRRLVATLWTIYALMLITAISTMFTMVTAIAWIPLTVLMCIVWTMLSLVANRQGEAPRHALDEWELRQRDSARSIGLTATQVILVPVAFALIYLSVLEIGDPQLLAYAGGGLVLVGCLVGGTLPTALIAWSRRDDDERD